MRYHVLPAAVTAALLSAGCGGGTERVVVGGDGRNPSETAAGATVVCGDAEYDPAVLADAPTTSSLPDGLAEAADDAGEPAFDPSQEWRVVHQSDDRVELIRELEGPMDHGQGDVRTHEVRVIERIFGATNVPEGSWLLTLAGPCTQRLSTHSDVGEADLTLAREHSPDEAVVEVLVYERACASGRSAEGRVELIELVETDEQVRLRIGVRPREGGQDCPSNPPTPFSVELAAALGDREIVDASVVPARALVVEPAPDE